MQTFNFRDEILEDQHFTNIYNQIQLKTFIIILSRQQVHNVISCNIKEQVISIFE